MKKTFLTVLILAATVSFAQEDTKEVEEVLIQGKFLSTPYQKIVENIEVISKKEIENSPAQSIDELLQQFSGLDIRKRGANGVQSDISLRGGTFDQVLILVNGIPMNDAQTGHNVMNLPIDLSAIEKIEILKGPAARRFGNNAYAGAINIITKPSAEEKVKIKAEGGDFQTYALGLVSSFGTDKFQNLLQTTSTGSQGYKHNTDYTVRNVFYQGKIPLNNGSFGVQAGFSEKKFGANGFYASRKATEQYEEVQTSLVSFNYAQKFQHFALNSSVYWRRGQDMYLYNRQKPEIYRNMHITHNIGGTLNASYQWLLGTTGLGTEVRNEGIVSNNLGERDRFITQVFFEHNFSFFNDNLKITPGVTWAKYSSVGDYFYPGVDIGFRFNPHHKIYGNIAKVHRVPTFTDLYYKSKTEEGNPDLKSESALSAEVGYAFQMKNFSFKVSGFGRDTDNMIDWNFETLDNKWHSQNLVATRVTGFEAGSELSLPFINTTFGLSYTYLNNALKSDKVSDKSKYILENLRHQLVARMENRVLGNFYNQTIYRYQDRQMGGYSINTLDEKLSYRKNGFETYIVINNLTNNKYTDAFGIEMPGRWFHIGVSYTIGIN